MNQIIQSIGRDYFNLLGERLPQQTASDEFYFLPRSAAAAEHPDTLDAMDPERIEALLSRVGDLLRSLPEAAMETLEDEVDRRTIIQSMERFLWEFGSARAWRHDPTLYVKIPLFAIDEILSRTATSADEIRDALIRRLSQIPQFLDIGLKNLDAVSEMSLEVASDMVGDAIAFLRRDVPLFVNEKLSGDEEALAVNRGVLTAWDDFKKGLEDVLRMDSFAAGRGELERILTTGLGCHRSPEEVLHLAEASYRSTREKTVKLAAQIDGSKPWQALVQEEPTGSHSSLSVPALYRREVEKLRSFFRSNDVVSFPEQERAETLPTPSYLQSLRATASYRAPLTGRPGTAGVFHITPGTTVSKLVRSHRPYLSAHETYPGHHLLDMVRIHHPNPIRRQIEAPLFYEGWACYAETLLDDLGYTTDPRQRLVQLQRKLWRDLRAILDMKLQTGTVTTGAAADRIEELGFSAETAQRQVRRFALTPGYQSCYFLGMHEIVRLRDEYSGRLGLKGFHDTLLAGGQIRFDLAEKRLEAACGRDSG